MFKVVDQTLALCGVNLSEYKLRPQGKHTYALYAPGDWDERGLILKFQKGRIPQLGDIIHLTRLADDYSRTPFDRHVLAIQRKHDGYQLYMDNPPVFDLVTDAHGRIIGYKYGSTEVMIHA